MGRSANRTSLPGPVTSSAIQYPDPSWWLCRARIHAWPRREHAETCCHSHRITCVLGFEPADWPGPEPVVPVTGTGAGHCFVLVPWTEVDTWTPPAGGSTGGEYQGPGPYEYAGLPVRTIAWVNSHRVEAEAEMR